MSENSVLYDVLAERVAILAESFDNNVPYHRFSHRYMRKEKGILKAYLKSKEKRESVDCAYNIIKRGNRIKFAFIVVIAALLLAGFTIYITHYIGQLQINEYDTHSFAFALDSDNSPKKLENRYEITYDLNDWEREIMNNDQYDYWEIYKYDDNYISFSYCVKSSYQGIRYNSEESDIETIIIGDKNVIHFISPKGINCLIWESDDYIFQFNFTIDYNEAVNIINSIAKQ